MRHFWLPWPGPSASFPPLRKVETWKNRLEITLSSPWGPQLANSVQLQARKLVNPDPGSGRGARAPPNICPTSAFSVRRHVDSFVYESKYVCVPRSNRSPHCLPTPFRCTLRCAVRGRGARGLGALLLGLRSPQLTFVDMSLERRSILEM